MSEPFIGNPGVFVQQKSGAKPSPFQSGGLGRLFGGRLWPAPGAMLFVLGLGAACVFAE